MQPRQILLILAIAAGFGVLVPILKGFDFFDSRLIVAYACLSAVIAAPIVADTFTAPVTNPVTRLIRTWLFAFAFATALLALALLTVNLTRGHGRLILPRTNFLLAAECLSLTLAAAVAAAGALLAQRFSAVNLKAGFRAVFLLAAVALFLADREGALTMATSRMTRMLFIVSAVLGAAALMLHFVLTAMLRVDDAPH